MLGELMNIPTDTLIDMLYIILAGEVAISASDATEIEQIQRELQRRGATSNAGGFKLLIEKRRAISLSDECLTSTKAGVR
jgi:hypothetical protein